MPTYKWMPVEYTLPPDDGAVVIANRLWSDPVWLGYLDEDGDWRTVEGVLLADDEGCESEDLLPPTHWMPMLPPPPPERKADDPPPLLLPAPRPHVCQTCGIDHLACVIFDGSPGYSGLYFVEHDSLGLSGEPWDLCADCEAKWQHAHHLRFPEIFLSRGAPVWHKEGWVFPEFEDAPLICVSDASAADFRADRETGRETWLYCRNRAEWTAAWEVARCIVRDGFTLFKQQERGKKLLNLLAGYKPPGASFLVVNTWKGGAQ